MWLSAYEGANPSPRTEFLFLKKRNIRKNKDDKQNKNQQKNEEKNRFGIS